MHKVVSRVARESAGRIAALSGTTAAVSSTRGPAHAKVPAQNVELAPAASSCQSEWMITQLDAGNVIFRPEDIDEVANEVLQLVPRQASHFISQSETESDGQEATSVIEANDLSGSQLNRPSTGQLNVLMCVATELMKKPGIQKEMMDAIMDNPELVQMLSEKSNMNNCLSMLGVGRSGLLSAPVVIEEVTDQTQEESESEDDSSPLDALMARLMNAFGKMGEGVQHVTNWVKRIFQGPPPAPNKADGAPPGETGNFFDAFNNNPFVKAAVVLGVMMVCVLLLRRPQLLAALMRKKVVTAAAAAGAAAVARK